MKNISKTDLCKELLTRNPNLSCKEIMKKVNCSDSVVYSARYELKKEYVDKITSVKTSDVVSTEPVLRPSSYYTVSKALPREDFLAFLRGSLVAAITSNNWTEIDEIVNWYIDARTAPTTCRS